MLKMCPDCTLKSRKMYRTAFFFFFLCHQDNFWCDLHWWTIFYTVLWIDPRSTASVSPFSTTCSLCLTSASSLVHGFPPQPADSCLQLLEGEHNPSETLAKAWTSVIKRFQEFLLTVPTRCHHSWMVTPDTSLPAKGRKLCCRMCWFAKGKKITGRVWFLQCSSCAKWAERGVFSISATSWKWKCHIFQHFLSKFSPSLPIIHSALTGTRSLAWPVLGVLLYNVWVSICFPLASCLPASPFAFQEMVESTEGKTKLLFLRLPSGDTQDTFITIFLMEHLIHRMVEGLTNSPQELHLSSLWVWWGLGSTRLLQRGFGFIISDSVYRASQAETPKSHSSPLKKM